MAKRVTFPAVSRRAQPRQPFGRPHRRARRREQDDPADRVERAAVARETRGGQLFDERLVRRQEEVERGAIPHLPSECAGRPEHQFDLLAGLPGEPVGHFGQRETEVGRSGHDRLLGSGGPRDNDDQEQAEQVRHASEKRRHRADGVPWTGPRASGISLPRHCATVPASQ